MGTNYYRIPSEQEMESRKTKLIELINNIDVSPGNIGIDFKTIPIKNSQSSLSLWDQFTEDVKIHLGKRSAGWKFIWNFNNKRLYKNKEELFNFIRSGRIVDEYGTEIDVEEFIEMALDWYKKDGLDANSYRRKHPHQYYYDYEEKEYYIDGLRISPHTDFC
jgi:hypothetical protein